MFFRISSETIGDIEMPFGIYVLRACQHGKTYFYWPRSIRSRSSQGTKGHRPTTLNAGLTPFRPCPSLLHCGKGGKETGKHWQYPTRADRKLSRRAQARREKAYSFRLHLWSLGYGLVNTLLQSIDIDVVASSVVCSTFDFRFRGVCSWLDGPCG